MHKVAKLDDDGDPIYETEKDELYAEMRELYKYTPAKIFDKAFNKLWNEMGTEMDGYALEDAMGDDLDRHETKMLKDSSDSYTG